MINKELETVLEQRAQAIGSLAYLKAKAGALGFMGRAHKEKSLYFILCGDAVKIGVSNAPQIRMESLRAGAPGPLRLLATIPKMGHAESECHKRLAHLNLYGEWFRYTEEVDKLILELKNGL